MAKTNKEVIGKMYTNETGSQQQTNYLTNMILTWKIESGIQKHATKGKIRKKIRNKFQEMLKRAGNKKSNVKFFLENRGEWKVGT